MCYDSLEHLYIFNMIFPASIPLFSMLSFVNYQTEIKYYEIYHQSIETQTKAMEIFNFGIKRTEKIITFA